MELLDIFGIFFMIFITISIFFASLYVYVYLSHPLDKEYPGSWFGRTLIITGMSSVYLLIILLDFDILSHYKSKNIGFGFNFEMDSAWLFAIYFCMFISFAQFFFIQYYRNSKPTSTKNKILLAFFITLIPIAGYSLISMNYFFTQSFSGFKLKYQTAELSGLTLSDKGSGIKAKTWNDKHQVKVNIEPALMIISPFLLLCSLAFSLFGGAGLAYYPASLIKAYLYRPKEIKAEDLVFQKNALKEDSKKLLEKAKDVYDLKRDLKLNQDMDKKELRIKKKVINRTSTELICDVLAFEDSYYSYKSSQNYTNQNPLYYISCLAIGIFGSIIGLIFLIDIILSFMRLNFLVDYLFMTIKGISSFYNLIFLFFLCVYVTIAVTKGSYKLSIIIFYLFQAFPIKGNRTWTDAFLLNNIVVLTSIIGFLLVLDRLCNIYFSYTSLDLLIKNVMRNPVLLFFYKYKIIRFLYIFSFLLAGFTSLFFNSTKEKLLKDSENLKKEYEKKKADYQTLNKEIK